MSSRPSWRERIEGKVERLSEPGRQTLGLGIGIGIPLLLFALATSLTPPPPAFDSPLERGVAGRTLDAFPVDLAADQALTVRVVQHGVDVAIRLLDPAGRELAAVDSRFGPRGTEALYAVAGRAGRHRLELLLTPARDPDARYVLTLERPRIASARDRRRFHAVQLLRQGEEEEKRGSFRAAQGTFLAAAGLLDPLAGELRASAFFKAGRMADGRRRFAQARNAYIAVLATGGVIERMLSWCRIGRVDGELQDLPGALEAYGRCTDEALGLGDRLTAAESLNESGALFQRTAKPQYALDALYRSQDLWPPGKNPADLAVVVNNLGILYRSLGQERPAEVYFSRALKLADGLGDRDLAVGVIGSLIQISPSIEKAEVWFEKARSYRPGAKAQAELDLHWGARLMQAGRLSEARQTLERAAMEAEREGEEPRLWNARALLAHVLDLEGQDSQALTAFDGPLRYYLEQKNLEGIYTILYGRAQALRDLGRLPEARREVQRALGLAESVRLETGGSEARGRYSVKFQDLYNLSITLAMNAGEVGRAFEILEQGRARTLLEDLSRRSLRSSPISLQLAPRRDDLKRQIADAHLRQELARLDAPSRSALSNGDARLERLFADLLEVQAESERQMDPQGQSLVAARPLTLAEIQRHLEPDTALLAYSLGKEEGFGWAVTSSSLKMAPLGPRAALEEDVRAAYRQLRLSPAEKHRDLPEAFRRLATLSSKLLGPFAETIRGRRLVVLADGALAQFPFGALPDPDDPSGSASLGARHDLAYTPSASVAILLNEEARQRPWPPRSLAVLADPVYDYGDERLAPSREPPPPAAAASRRATSLLEARRLRHADKEARGIAGLFKSPLLKLGFDASRDTVLDDMLGSYDAIHFATHGYAYPDRPQLSGIVLSLIGSDRRRQDGLLHSFEIYDLRLRAALVVLSGCETGLGEEVGSEGILGLVRGFFYAGAPRVVASLWSVDDEATAALMTRFYEAIEWQGMSAPAALRAAQETLRRDPRWQDPYYWAGFVLEGAWQGPD